MGTKSSGIHGHVRGWDIGGRVALEYCEVIEDDILRIEITGGSNRRHEGKRFGTYARNRFTGELVEYVDYKITIENARNHWERLRQDKDFCKQYKKRDFWEWYSKEVKK